METTKSNLNQNNCGEAACAGDSYVGRASGSVGGAENKLTLAEPNGFDWAIQCLKNGHPVKRAGWNGRGMCIYLNKGSVDFKPNDSIPPRIDGIPRRLFEDGAHGTTTRLPNIIMHTAGGATVHGWLASQADMLAEDWQFI